MALADSHTSSTDADARLNARRALLARCGWQDAEIVPLAGDASFRRYDRLYRANDRAVLMDAPPPHEDVRPYLHVTGLLEAARLSPPRVFGSDVTHGFVLMEDFGNDLFSAVIARDQSAETALYQAATDLLLALCHQPAPRDLPAYDHAVYQRELALFTDWYLPAVLGAPLPGPAVAEYTALWHGLLDLAQPGTPCLVLRDYHVDNLIWRSEETGHARIGLLDFQDALIGAPAYDLISLIEDARRDLGPGLAAHCFRRFVAGSSKQLDATRFRRQCRVVACQRHLKVLGIFTRLAKRDGKPRYLAHVPRLWRYVETHLTAEPALAPLNAWLAQHLPQARRIIPPLDA